MNKHRRDSKNPQHSPGPNRMEIPNKYWSESFATTAVSENRGWSVLFDSWTVLHLSK